MDMLDWFAPPKQTEGMDIAVGARKLNPMRPAAMSMA
jgi:hypothetical protein